MKYLLTRYENNKEVIVSYGDCSLDSMRQTVKNSPEFFKDGYVIYKTKVAEYSVHK